MIIEVRARSPLAVAVLLGAVARIGLADTAVAADLSPYAPPQFAIEPAYRPAFTWSGFYVGLQGGYSWGRTNAETTSVGSGETQTTSYDTGGFLGGAHAGFNWQAGSNLVLGVETDLEASRSDGSGIGTLGAVHFANIDWMGSLRGRIGYAAGNTLLYATGGLAYGGVSFDRALTVGAARYLSHSDWRTGWTLGAGVEHAIASNVTLRLEYRYTDFGKDQFATQTSGLIDGTEVTQSAIRAGLSFKF